MTSSRLPIALAVLCLLWAQGWSAPHRLGHALELVAAGAPATYGSGHVHAHDRADPSSSPSAGGHALAGTAHAHVAGPAPAIVAATRHGRGGDGRDADGLDCPSCPGVGAWLGDDGAPAASVAPARETRCDATTADIRGEARARCTIRGPPDEEIPAVT